MKDLEKKILNQFDSVVDDLMSNLNLSDRSEKETQEIHSFLREALGDRVNLFILENLSSDGLGAYEKLISVEDVDLKKMEELIIFDIKNFKNLLQEDLANFAKEVAGNFNK